MIHEAKYPSYVAIKLNFVLLTLLSPTLTIIKRKKSEHQERALMFMSY